MVTIKKRDRPQIGINSINANCNILEKKESPLATEKENN